MKISVIIPIYNAQTYLKQCLDSIINQSLKDIEVLCVNHDSNDDSLSILEEYSKKDDRIKILNCSHKNRGAGAPRNLGLDYAKGEYIHFIDPDDWIIEDTYKLLYDKSKNQNLDLLLFKAMNYKEPEGNTYTTPTLEFDVLNKYNKKILNINDLGSDMLELNGASWNKLIKRELITKINARFPEGIFSQDHAFSQQLYINAKQIGIIKKHLYYYRKHDESVTSNTNKKQFDIIISRNKVIEVYKKFNVYEEFESDLIEQKLEILRNTYKRMDKKYIDEFYSLLKEDFKKMKKNITEDVIYNLSLRNKLFYLNVISTKDNNQFKKMYKLNLKNEILIEENKKIKHENKILKNKEKELLSTTSWKITKPLRILGKLKRVKNMMFTETILNHSNSYKFYKKKYKKMITLEKENNNLKKENNNLKKENSKIKENIKNIEDSLKSLEIKFNRHHSYEIKSRLYEEEIRYGIVFKDTISKSKWLKNTNISLNNSASNYSFMYILFRILDECNPKNILELGLGQTTKLTTQYVNYFKESKLVNIEGNKEWIDNFSKKLNCEGNIQIIQNDIEKFIYNNSENIRYKNIKKNIKDEKFDLIIIDGPNGFNPETGEKLTYSRSNIWDLIPNNLTEEFIIIIDDYERDGEKNTVKIVEDLLKENNIDFYKFNTRGLKEQCVIITEKYKFISWF